MSYKIKIRNSSNNGWINILQDEYIEHDYITTGIGTSATNNVELALKHLQDNKDKSSGLELITENTQTGWRLIDRNASYYGDIGSNAIDLSTNTSSSTTRGATGEWSHAEGLSTTASGEASHAEGYATIASESTAHAEGRICTASGAYSHAQNRETTASGEASHSEGHSTIASGAYSHAGGKDTVASGNYSFAMGLSTHATGLYACTTGFGTSATNYMDCAHGYNTSAIGGYGSHSEGWGTTATERSAHAEGYLTEANGRYSHAEGWGTKTSTKYGQHVEGSYNIGTSTLTIHETGIGVDDTHRKNAFEIYTDGTLTAPEATVSEITSRGDDALITKEYLDSYRYMHTQSTATSAWSITHNLNQKLVSVSVMDASDDTQMIPSGVSYSSVNQLTLTFSTSVSGQALILK